jgi:putative membrane protein
MVIASLFIPLRTLIFFVFCFGLVSVMFHVVRYFTFRYLVTDRELVINSGVLSRQERRIPLDRVQEVEIHQGIVHRLLDLARLEITTAGSDAQEASLNVVSRQAAEGVKEAIGKSQGKAEQDNQVHDSDGQPDYVCQLGVRDLLMGGVTSRLVASVGAMIAAIVYLQVSVGHWSGKATEGLEHLGRRWPEKAGFDRLQERFESMLPDFGPFNFVYSLFEDTLPKLISFALLGLVGSAAAYAIRYHGFRLARSGDVLTTSFGLLALRRGSLARGRIQVIKLEEGLLRRYLGLASIRVDSAGDRREISESKKRDVLVPVASKAVAQKIAQQAMPGLTTVDPNWQRVSPRAVLRGSKKGWLLILAVMAQTFGLFGWLSLALLPFIPLVYFLNYQWFRHTGYFLDEHHFLSRKGWINRETVCLPVKNIQNISVTQNPFDRRVNLATLSIDTAGQSNTGGGPVIRHLPVEEAKRIQWSLADRVAGEEVGEPRSPGD